MERYSEYKDSGVKWLGEIPSHWEVEPFGRHFSFRKGLPITKANLIDSGEAVISYGQIHAKENLGTTMSESLVRYVSRDYLKSHPKCLLTKDDFVFADTSEDIGGSGNFVYNDFPANIFAGYHTIVAKQSGLYNPRYYAYLFKSECWRNHIRSLVNGVKVYSIGRKQLKSNFLLFPSYKEQDAIVRYLDAATSKIDKAIAMQQKMIDLLNERKQIIIQNAVTKGLDENVEMKNSGVEWIGMIPKHWEIVCLSRLTSKIGSGSTPKEGYVDNGVIFLRSQNVYCEGLRLDDVVHISLNVHRNMSGTRVLPNDVLINITGGSIGRCFYVDETLGEANVNQHVSIIRPTSVDTHYLKYYLQSYCGQIQVALEQTGGNREGLTAKALAKFLIVCPSKSEQQAVADYLDKQMQRFDSAITNCQRQITLLQERKQIIINEVVTGKAKVS